MIDDLSLLSDAELILIIVENREGMRDRAWNELWGRREHLADWLIHQKRYAFPLGWYSLDKHEDIKQDIAVEVFKSLKNYRGGSFKSFFGTISVIQIIHHIKKALEEYRQPPNRQENQGAKNLISSLEDTSFEKMSSEQRAVLESQQGENPEVITIKKMQKTAVGIALHAKAQKGQSELKCRIAIEKRVIEGWSWLDVGSAVGMKANSTEKMVERNFDKLRKILEESGWGSEDFF